MKNLLLISIILLISICKQVYARSVTIISNGIGIHNRTETIHNPGKGSIELEANDSSRLVIDEEKEIYKSSEQREKEEEVKRYKKKKFKEYYKKPVECQEPENQAIKIKCANEFIKAKARFEELYEEGKI